MVSACTAHGRYEIHGVCVRAKSWLECVQKSWQEIGSQRICESIKLAGMHAVSLRDMQHKLCKIEICKETRS